MALNRRHAAHAGFTYLGVLFVVALMALVLGSAQAVAALERRREQEQQLLFVGHQFREAIRLYYQATPGALKQFPPSLEALLQDARAPGIRRHLRRLYADPVTGKPQWGLVEGPGGSVMGVYSLSSQAPLKTGNFREIDLEFTGKTAYSDWKFVYVPPQAGNREAAGQGVMR